MSNQTPGIFFNAYKAPRGVWRSDIKFNTDLAGNGITIRGAHMCGWFDAVKHALLKSHAFLKSPVGHGLFLAAASTLGPEGTIAAEGALRVLDKVATAANQAPTPGVQLAKVSGQFTDPNLRRLARGIAQLAQGRATSMSGGPVCLLDLKHALESKGANPTTRGSTPPPWGMQPFPMASINGQGDPSAEVAKAMMEAMMGNPFGALAGAHERDKHKHRHRHVEMLKQREKQLDYQRKLARAAR